MTLNKGQRTHRLLIIAQLGLGERTFDTHTTLSPSIMASPAGRRRGPSARTVNDKATRAQPHAHAEVGEPEIIVISSDSESDAYETDYDCEESEESDDPFEPEGRSVRERGNPTRQNPNPTADPEPGSSSSSDSPTMPITNAEEPQVRFFSPMPAGYVFVPKGDVYITSPAANGPTQLDGLSSW